MQSFSSSVDHVAGLILRRALLAEGLMEATVQFRDGQIAAYGGSPTRGMIDYGDPLVLPGTTDLHGDTFERAVMPRPSMASPYEITLADADGQLLAYGITTEFHGVAYSREGGLRGRTCTMCTPDILDVMRPHLGAQYLMHSCLKLHHADGVADVFAWMDAGHVYFLSSNDHLSMMRDKPDDARKFAQHTDRVEYDIDIFLARLNAAAVNATRLNEVTGTLTRAAQQRDICMASHDEPDTATHNTSYAHGYIVTEFSSTEDVVRAARVYGGHTVFGASNVVRDGSHHGAPNAPVMMAVGLGIVLASSYYYPTLLAVPFKLAERGAVPLAEVWAPVAANPVEAVGLTDRGVPVPGLRVDAIVVDDRRPGLPCVVVTVVGGRLRHVAGQLPLIG